MADEKKPPPKLSDFKDLLRKLVRVPKEEVEQKAAEHHKMKERRRRLG
jgi:hypothetical protein